MVPVFLRTRRAARSKRLPTPVPGSAHPAGHPGLRGKASPVRAAQGGCDHRIYQAADCGHHCHRSHSRLSLFGKLCPKHPNSGLASTYPGRLETAAARPKASEASVVSQVVAPHHFLSAWPRENKPATSPYISW